MKRKVGTIFLAALTTIFITSPIIPMALASVSHNGHVPDYLQIISVTMNDYNLRCAAMGGQYVNISVNVTYTGQTPTTEDFYIYLFINQVGNLTVYPVQHAFAPGQPYIVPIPHIYISWGIGNNYTLDAYINNDLATHNCCSFRVTAFGDMEKQLTKKNNQDVVYSQKLDNSDTALIRFVHKIHVIGIIHNLTIKKDNYQGYDYSFQTHNIREWEYWRSSIRSWGFSFDHYVGNGGFGFYRSSFRGILKPTFICGYFTWPSAYFT